jgi:hypothetical protein
MSPRISKSRRKIRRDASAFSSETSGESRPVRSSSVTGKSAGRAVMLSM